MPNRRVKRICEVCEGPYDYSYPAQRTCGRACGVLLKQCVTGSMGVAQANLARPRVRFIGPCSVSTCERSAEVLTYCRPHYRAKRLGQDYIRGDLVSAGCVECGKTFRYVLESNHRNRCEACMRANSKAAERKYRRARREHHRDRARRFGVHYEPIKVHTIFERDGWICQLCGDPVDQTLKSPEQMAASLDHVVPMSKGGPHQPDNVQLAHWLCNSLKGADETLSFRIAS